MKKLLLLSNLGWMLITVLIMGNAMKTPDKAAKDPAKTAKGPEAIMLTSSAPQPCPDCAIDSFHGLDASKFLQGLARYRKYDLKAINARLSAEGFMGGQFQDARSCWYSIETLDKFICLMKKDGCNLGIPTSELGIRFYYAAYDAAEQSTTLLKTGSYFRDIKIDVGLHHTLFMVPTHYNEQTKFDEDYDPRLNIQARRAANNDRLPISSIWTIYSQNPHAKLMILDNAIFQSNPSVQNQGMLCPPTCPGAAAATLNNVDANIPDNAIPR